MVGKFEIALSQLEKFTRKRKAEAKSHKHIIEEPKLDDARNEKYWKQFAMVKQKKKSKKPLKKIIKAR